MNEVCQWHKELMLEVRCKMLDEGIPIHSDYPIINMFQNQKPILPYLLKEISCCKFTPDYISHSSIIIP